MRSEKWECASENQVTSYNRKLCFSVKSHFLTDKNLYLKYSRGLQSKYFKSVYYIFISYVIIAKEHSASVNNHNVCL